MNYAFKKSNDIHKGIYKDAVIGLLTMHEEVKIDPD